MVPAVVKSGTVLRAVARGDRWIEVLVAAKAGGKGNTGFVLAAHVEHIAGTPDVPLRQPRDGESHVGCVRHTDEGAIASRARSPTAARRSAYAGVRLGGSYMLFQAKDNFDAIFGSEWQPFYGGGAQVGHLHDRLFVEGSFEQFKKTGQRVVVADGEVLPLGIEDQVTINPITVTAPGIVSVSTRPGVTSGGGVGSYHLRETSDFADPSENVDERSHAATTRSAASRWG